ncbi:hypothetical protein K469DRAFT_728181 [Zopfia rhizophila CBS 207.26]|uniref:Dynamin GTPase domain-containing protein n=1 Tax=Zopfia rhizophila CBS 207.26 TaxID=1314779 RepID=A0A6A6DVR1_9PEZI|nr:hypothetical protein K469DRAFT_728181 [Zopfia rhizophila CBS 207.26]
MATDSSSDLEWDSPATPVTPIAIDSNAVTTNSLEALQSDEQRRAVDIVDKLRRTGLRGIVGLSQLVVCGDQSSDKSSVLEAITEIPFPRKESLCTRFATEIVLRRDPTSTTKITITPDKNRDKQEQAKLKSFNKSIKDFSQLPDIIEDATLAVGLGRVGEINSKAFSRDVLSVEICGPDRPQDIDTKSEWTLGIITKPDYLPQNKNIYFKLRWHMLKHQTFFFSKGRYSDLPRDSVGIDSLRARLSLLLLNHLKKELPSLKEEMSTKLHNMMDEIERLGEKRTIVSEQRMMLVKISMHINDILRSAVKGYYDSPFFGSINTNAPINSMENIQRFRSVIQHLNLWFANNMRLRGHKYVVGAGPVEESISSPLPKPKTLTGPEIIEWVQKVLERPRGFELPGNFNAVTISQLFWEQSQPWEEIASKHIRKVACACKDFVYMVLKHSAPAEFLYRLTTKKSFARSPRTKARHPMTYNYYFTITIQKQRQRKYQRPRERATKESVTTVSVDSGFETGTRTLCDPVKMEEAMADSIEQDMDKFSSEEAMDDQRACYKYFTNAVAKQVIERHLVEPPPSIILSL